MKSESRNFIRHIVLIAVIALGLRLALLYLVFNQNSVDTLYSQSPDVSNYVQSAEAIADSFSFDTLGIGVLGPVYPVFLALAMTISDSRVLPFILQILMSTGTTLLSYLIVRQLVDSRTAVIAAALNAFSLTSITLSSVLLSETLFVFLAALGLHLYLYCLSHQRFATAFASGVVLSAAILTRAAGIYLPIVLVVIFVARRLTSPRLKRPSLMPLAVTFGIMLASITSWSAITYARDGTFVVAHSQTIARDRMFRWLHTKIDNVSPDSAQFLVSQTVADRMELDSIPYFPAHKAIIDSLVGDILSRHLLASMNELSVNMVTNISTEQGLLALQLPRWSEEIKRVFSWMDAHYVGSRTVVLSFIGFLILFVSGYRVAAFALGAICLYFWALSAFTLWQGPRITHPAIIGWAGLVAVSIGALWDWCKRRTVSKGNAV